jgi:hypothetical protein
VARGRAGRGDHPLSAAADRHSRLARSFLWAFNRQGGFDSLEDTEGGLQSIISRAFEQVQLDVVGSIAVFVATKPRRPAE